MKRILLSLIIIALAGSTAIRATRAYFTSDVDYTQNTFSSGTIILTDTRENWMLPFSISDIKPGDTIRRWVTFKNNGTLDIDYLTVNKSNVVDTSNLLNQINVSVACTSSASGSETAYFTDDWGTKPTINSWFVNSDMLDHSYYHTAAGILHPSESYVCTLDFSMPTSVDNTFQGKSATFDLTFIAEQSH